MTEKIGNQQSRLQGMEWQFVRRQQGLVAMIRHKEAYPPRGINGDCLGV